MTVDGDDPPPLATRGEPRARVVQPQHRATTPAQHQHRQLTTLAARLSEHAVAPFSPLCHPARRTWYHLCMNMRLRSLRAFHQPSATCDWLFLLACATTTFATEDIPVVVESASAVFNKIATSPSAPADPIPNSKYRGQTPYTTHTAYKNSAGSVPARRYRRTVS